MGGLLPAAVPTSFGPVRHLLRATYVRSVRGCQAVPPPGGPPLRPGRDLFLVFTEERGVDDDRRALADRGMVVKLTCLFRF